MKAQKVFENINFERGLDPKTSMKIGRKWTPSELAELYKKLVPRLGKYKKAFSTEAWENIPMRMNVSAGWGNLDKIFNELNPEEFDQMKDFILKYNNLTK
jgi:hypothetical protein